MFDLSREQCELYRQWAKDNDATPELQSRSWMSQAELFTELTADEETQYGHLPGGCVVLSDETQDGGIFKVYWTDGVCGISDNFNCVCLGENTPEPTQQPFPACACSEEDEFYCLGSRDDHCEACPATTHTTRSVFTSPCGDCYIDDTPADLTPSSINSCLDKCRYDVSTQYGEEYDNDHDACQDVIICTDDSQCPHNFFCNTATREVVKFCFYCAVTEIGGNAPRNSLCGPFELGGEQANPCKDRCFDNDPSNNPTISPTMPPTMIPTINPTNSPSIAPTKEPSKSPTFMPTNPPTSAPSPNPTQFRRYLQEKEETTDYPLTQCYFTGPNDLTSCSEGYFCDWGNIEKQEQRGNCFPCPSDVSVCSTYRHPSNYECYRCFDQVCDAFNCRGVRKCLKTYYDERSSECIDMDDDDTIDCTVEGVQRIPTSSPLVGPTVGPSSSDTPSVSPSMPPTLFAAVPIVVDNCQGTGPADPNSTYVLSGNRYCNTFIESAGICEELALAADDGTTFALFAESTHDATLPPGCIRHERSRHYEFNSYGPFQINEYGSDSSTFDSHRTTATCGSNDFDCICHGESEHIPAPGDNVYLKTNVQCTHDVMTVYENIQYAEHCYYAAVDILELHIDSFVYVDFETHYGDYPLGCSYNETSSQLAWKASPNTAMARHLESQNYVEDTPCTEGGFCICQVAYQVSLPATNDETTVGGFKCNGNPDAGTVVSKEGSTLNPDYQRTGPLLIAAGCHITLTKGNVYGGVNHAIVVVDSNITIASYDFDHFYDTTIIAINSDVTLAKVRIADGFSQYGPSFMNATGTVLIRSSEFNRGLARNAYNYNDDIGMIHVDGTLTVRDSTFLNSVGTIIYATNLIMENVVLERVVNGRFFVAENATLRNVTLRYGISNGVAAFSVKNYLNATDLHLENIHSMMSYAKDPTVDMNPNHAIEDRGFPFQTCAKEEDFRNHESFTYPSSMIFIDTTSDNVLIDNLVMDNVHFSTVVYSDISCEQYFYPDNAAIMSFDNDIYISNVKVESFQSNFLYMVGGSLYAEYCDFDRISYGAFSRYVPAAVFVAKSTTSFTLHNVKLHDINSMGSGGGVWAENTDVHLDSVEMSKFKLEDVGGCLNKYGSGSVYLDGSTFKDFNTQRHRGMCVYFNDFIVVEELDISNCTFQNFRSENGGAVIHGIVQHLSIDNSRFINVWNEFGTTLEFIFDEYERPSFYQYETFETSQSRMGEVFFPEAEMLNVSVEDIRGGFLSFMGSVSVDSSEFKHINANISFESYGGAIHNFRVIYENETTVMTQLRDVTFKYVSALGEGGAIYGLWVNVERCHFEGCKSTYGSGGAIHGWDVQVSANTTFVETESILFGSAIHSDKNCDIRESEFYEQHLGKGMVVCIGNINLHRTWTHHTSLTAESVFTSLRGNITATECFFSNISYSYALSAYSQVDIVDSVFYFVDNGARASGLDAGVYVSGTIMGNIPGTVFQSQAGDIFLSDVNITRFDTGNAQNSMMFETPPDRSVTVDRVVIDYISVLDPLVNEPTELDALTMRGTFVPNGQLPLIIKCDNYDSMCANGGEQSMDNFRCKKCPLTTYSVVEDGNVQILVNNHSNVLNSHPECFKCPNGATCEGEVDVHDGYYKVIYKGKVSDGVDIPTCTTSDDAEALLYRTYRCPTGYCSDDDDDDDDMCTGGRTGLLCGRCKEDHSAAYNTVQCIPDEDCDAAWKQLLYQVMSTSVLAWFTMKSVQQEEKESVRRSTLLINMAIITAQLYQSVALPYTSSWDLVISITEYFSLSVDSSGEGACIAGGMEATDIFIMNICSVMLVYIWITLFECFTANGINYSKIVKYFTLAFFLMVEPMYVNSFKIINCTDLIVDQTGRLETRAYYSATKECWDGTQYTILFVIVLLSMIILLVGCFHNEKDRDDNKCCCALLSCCNIFGRKLRLCDCGWRLWMQRRLERTTLKAVTDEMEKPYHGAHNLTRLWGYILILCRITMTAIYTMIPSDNRVVSAWILLTICFLMAAFTYRYYPFQGGKVTNQASVFSWVGLMTLATCQLCAEIQIRGNVDSKEYDYIKLAWAVTMFIHWSILCFYVLFWLFVDYCWCSFLDGKKQVGNTKMQLTERRKMIAKLREEGFDVVIASKNDPMGAQHQKSEVSELLAAYDGFDVDDQKENDEVERQRRISLTAASLSKQEVDVLRFQQDIELHTVPGERSRPIAITHGKRKRPESDRRTTDSMWDRARDRRMTQEAMDEYAREQDSDASTETPPTMGGPMGMAGTTAGGHAPIKKSENLVEGEVYVMGLWFPALIDQFYDGSYSAQIGDSWMARNHNLVGREFADISTERIRRPTSKFISDINAEAPERQLNGEVLVDGVWKPAFIKVKPSHNNYTAAVPTYDAEYDNHDDVMIFNLDEDHVRFKDPNQTQGFGTAIWNTFFGNSTRT